MGFKQLKERRIEQTKKLLNNIKDNTDKTAKDIKEYIKYFLSTNINWTIVTEDLTSFIYKSLKETYLASLQGLYEIYDISHPDRKKKVIDIDREIIDNLTYQGDNLTVFERIQNHCEDYQVMDITSESTITYDMFKILDTETIFVMNNTIKNNIEKTFEYAALEESECCEVCKTHIDKGAVPIKEFDAPPYHPNCECIVVFFTTDEINHI